MKTIHSISLAALLSAGSASAAVIGVNFSHGDWPNPTGINAGENTQALDNALSIVGPTSWNNHAITGAGASDSGSILGIGMTLFRSNVYNAGSEGVSATDDASQQVFRMYLDDHESPNTYAQNDGIGASVHLTGLTAALGGDAYRVHVLLNTDTDNASLANVTLYDGVAADPATTQITSLSVLGTVAPTVLGNGTQPVATDQNATQGTRGYATFGGANGFTADNIVIAGASNNGSARAPIAGFIIETVPEPSTTALLGLGGLALILRRRK